MSGVLSGKPKRLLFMLALGKMRLHKKGQAHANNQNPDGNLSTMSGLSGPDFTVFKPVKHVHGNYPWEKGEKDL